MRFLELKHSLKVFRNIPTFIITLSTLLTLTDIMESYVEFLQLQGEDMLFISFLREQKKEHLKLMDIMFMMLKHYIHF